MAHSLRIAAIGWIGLWAVFGPVPPARGADSERSLEYPVKAAFLVNFAKFAEWPADSPQSQASAVSICVLGRDPFGEVLDKAIAGRLVGGRPIVIRRHHDVEEVRTCHVLFVANSESGRLSKILERLADQPILSVGERDGFARKGGVIGLFVEDNLARFEVNLRAARHTGLLLSSKLLGVARVVEDVPAGER